jgi:hypothetical protein
MITEAELIDVLPMTAEWTQEQRASLAAAIMVLNGAKMDSPDVSGYAGLIIARGDVRIVGWFPIECIAQQAMPFVELDPQSIKAIHSPGPPDAIDIVAVIDQYELVFSPPIAVVRVVPGGENN